MSKSATINSSMKSNHASTSKAAAAQMSRSTKIIVGASVAILVVGGLIIAAVPDPVASTPASVESRSAGSKAPAGALTALIKTFNFGSISMAGGKVNHRFAIRNAGTEPILIRKMYTSCMCTTAALVKSARIFGPFGMPGHGPIPTINESMGAGEGAFIDVVFDPAAHGPAGIGPTNRVVTIENSTGQALELAFHANVTP